MKRILLQLLFLTAMLGAREPVQLETELPSGIAGFVELGVQFYDGNDSLLCERVDVEKDLQRRGEQLGADIALLAHQRMPDSTNDCFRTMVTYYRYRTIEDDPYNPAKSSIVTRNMGKILGITALIVVGGFLLLAIMIVNSGIGGAP